MTSLTVTDIPVEVWLDNILTHLPLADLLRLGCANRFFYLLASDEPFWHRKLQQDFNFPSSDTARLTGWKFLYRRLRNPQVFVWGDPSHSRLGLPHLRGNYGTGVPTPTRLRIPGVRIVNLIACGMSFHALDDQGNLYAWGVLDGTSFAMQSDGFSEGGKTADVPKRLNLPVGLRSISCGRLHASALDANSNIWTFTSWGRPFRIQSPLLDKASPSHTPVQVESGWAFTALLMESGDVLVYWPCSGEMQEKIGERFRVFDGIEGSKAIPSDEEPNVIPCYIWTLEGVDPVRLPPIPHQLPDLLATGLSEEENRKETRLVKIAGMDNNLIGLTNKGHVLRFNKLSGENKYLQGSWEYLPYFSDVAKMAELDIFSSESENPLPVPQTMHITHISAHFKTFVAYSAGSQSVVLMGTFETEDEDVRPSHREPLKPIIHRKLQYQSVISVVLGDYHFGALTGTGKLFTWGAYSKGALGLGNPADIPAGEAGGFATDQQRRAALGRTGRLIATPPGVTEPAEVRFDHGEKRRRNKYCFAVTAAGWHMGALVIDLDVT
ncbi:RCC1/BLIP-II [Cristinia sonorae]|uniref:RCC1/BLIP-II n=1 Tax=Cristinia sonorae TaxID=1940300 RepID=A0A8K0UL12_9AGAR|nr:RCC1/BLIP-II [Cristinia sonorae]